MPSAFIFINTETGFEDTVLEQLQIPSVKETHLIYGVYDIIAKIDAESVDRLKETISVNIRHLDKVRSTLTLIVKEG